MNTKKAIVISVLSSLIFLGAASGISYYTFEKMNYITSDDAQLVADTATVSVLTPGQLSSWKGKEGTSFAKGDSIGAEVSGNSNTDIKSPISGTIIKSNAVEDSFVSPGQSLAMISDLKNMYVVANIPETDIQNVSVGKDVDVTIDADSGKVYKGKVDSIGFATASTFSILPSDNTSGNYTKVEQRVPVKISLSEGLGDKLVPGMNVEVKISR